MKRIYFDYASTTPVAPEVEAAMRPYFGKKFGNPSSLHFFGQEASSAVDGSREKIAALVGADFREVIFTGSATEANNLVLRGAAEGFRLWVLGFNEENNSLKTNTYNLTPRIIVSSIEHESILETCRDLEKDGVETVYLPVNEQGLVDLKKLESSLNERTMLVSVMYANNEIGTIQPLQEISKIINRFREERRFSCGAAQGVNGSERKPFFFYPLFHTDAVQAFQFLDCDVGKLGVDLMTFSAHKMYGPKGVGALYIRGLKPKTYNLKPIITGGGQEFGLRSGTENVPAIVGFAKAAELVSNSRELENKRIRALHYYFWKELLKIYPKAKINGGLKRLPNVLNICFPGLNAEGLLVKLDLAGIAVSSGAACSARAPQPSHVLAAIGLKEKEIESSVRFSFGQPTSEGEIKESLRRIKKIL